jgi:hypothetical protein
LFEAVAEGDEDGIRHQIIDSLHGRIQSFRGRRSQFIWQMDQIISFLRRQIDFSRGPGLDIDVQHSRPILYQLPAFLRVHIKRHPGQIGRGFVVLVGISFGFRREFESL